jgi:hypothetical protein
MANSLKTRIKSAFNIFFWQKLATALSLTILIKSPL